jgi:hypothetical protein
LNPLPPIRPLAGAAYGLRCPVCTRAALYLRPSSFTAYGKKNLYVGASTIYHHAMAPHRHDITDGMEIRCQWCGSFPLEIHTSQFAQFDIHTGFTVDELQFLLN